MCFRFALLLAAFGTLHAQSESLGPLSCISELQLPNYVLLAWQSRVQAKYSVFVRLDDDGIVTKVSIKASLSRGASVLLEREIRQAIEVSRFKTRCTAAELVCSFSLEGPESEHLRTTIKYRSPNEFGVVAAPPKNMMEPSERRN